MTKRLFLGISIILSLSLMSLSAEVVSLDRDACFSQALENNSNLLNAALTLDAAKRADAASWNLLLPEITGSVALSGSASISEGTSATAFGINPGLSASYTLSPGLRESIEALRLEVEAASISYEDVRLQLLMSVESEFYYLLTSRNNLEIEKSNIELAKKQYEQTQIKFENGLVSQLEVLQARVNAANLVPSYSSLESTYKNRLKEFLVVLGIDPQTEIELVGSLDVEARDFDAEDLIERYLYNRTDIQAQMKQIEVLENSLVQVKRNGRLPAVTLSASWAENISSPFSASTWQNYSSNSSGTFSLGINLGLDNYIPGSSTDIGICETEDTLKQAELTLDTLIQTARLEIINVIDSLKTDRENLELSRLNLELSEKSYGMTEESFLKGKSSRLQLDDAQQDLLTARQNLLESQYEYMNDLITLRGALGLESLEELEQGL